MQTKAVTDGETQPSATLEEAGAGTAVAAKMDVSTSAKSVVVGCLVHACDIDV